MKRTVKNYKDFIKENVDTLPEIKPTTKPTTKPNTTPNRPSPLRRDKPGVDVKPKATAEDIADKYLEMVKNDTEIQDLLKNKYNN